MISFGKVKYPRFAGYCAAGITLISATPNSCARVIVFQTSPILSLVNTIPTVVYTRFANHFKLDTIWSKKITLEKFREGPLIVFTVKHYD